MKQEGFEKILAIRSSVNRGLSPNLKIHFPDIIPVALPKVDTKNIPDPVWIQGFTEGEGSFIINKQKNNSKLGAL